MKKKLKSYIELMRERSKEPLSDSEREKIKREMLIRISFFQHERLVHLIVTVLFALLTVIGIVASFIICNMGFVLLTLLFLVLLVPYVYHYYVLENGVQTLYDIYNDL